MQKAKLLMQALLDKGYQAYIVGGAVRDYMMGKTASDIDIATNARPEAVRDTAAERGWPSIAVGAAFGVMVVVVDGGSYEVASYRSEIYGSDSHRPDSVAYCTTLAEDLSRRDFTMNALAMAADGELIDPYGGLADIQARRIRTVGDPLRRFAEDGLRMFRAARFSAQLGFAIDPATLQAISSCLQRISGLSVERVRTELEKTLLADYPDTGLTVMLKSGLLDGNCRRRDNGQDRAVPILPELRHLYGLPQNPCYHCFDGWGHTLAAVCQTPRDLTLRWAALLHDIGKGWPGIRIVNRQGNYSDPGHDAKGAELAAAILTRLKLPPADVKRISWLIRHHMHLPRPDDKAVLKWLKRLAKSFVRPGDMRQAVEQLLQLHRADRAGGHVIPGLDEWRQVWQLCGGLLERIPFFPEQLAVSGGEIARLLGAGVQIRQFQADLLVRVQSGLLDNSRESLLTALAARARRKMLKSGPEEAARGD
ncbi:MAG: CCA tRNA nucleotidyltransferase [Sporomusaceae bacterium]|nr:CCA tRNA nucleotidyltransferase [Sporomusaceae bacterium]